MPISLLRQLALKELPFTVTGGEDVDAVHILAIAGHVHAVIASAVRSPLGWRNPSAVVHSITASGRRMLRLFPQRDHDGGRAAGTDA
ncbi:hypothetical protein [Variovorax sp. UMC13]|uniref:hypothetical protein n=1 Tax=Variovorax sp. UMC13 TaxID=1862326 RepID=UPI0015FEC8A5|nr:hypothetical protein [Variovorax sp. UMC13]